jgi:hypothetical protein
LKTLKKQTKKVGENAMENLTEDLPAVVSKIVIVYPDCKKITVNNRNKAGH